MDKPEFPYDFESSIGYWITITSHCYQRTLNDELSSLRHHVPSVPGVGLAGLRW